VTLGFVGAFEEERDWLGSFLSWRGSCRVLGELVGFISSGLGRVVFFLRTEHLTVESYSGVLF